MSRPVLALCALLALAGCDKKDAAATAPAETPPAAPASVAPAPAPVAEPVVDVATLPVEEQYEADAEKEITAQNLSAKLDELEKEIATP